MDINTYKQVLLDQRKEKTNFRWKALLQDGKKFILISTVA
jgi:hypothetical protein